MVTAHPTDAGAAPDAASQGTVDGSELHDYPLLRPAEILETVPGLVVTQHSGDGKANQYFLRGYNLDHGTDLATTVDGVPVNMPTNAHGQGYSDLNFLIPELVERIDYLEGPYYAQWGDFSAAGAAQIRYRDQLDTPRADLTVGSFGYYRALLAGSCDSLQSDCALSGGTDVRELGALELIKEDGPWTSAEDLHKINGLLRLSEGTVANGWSMDGILYDARWNSTDQVPLELIESGQLGRYSALDATDGGDSSRAVWSGEWHQSDAAGYTRASAYVEHYQLQLWSDFTFFELRPATGDQFEQEEHRNFFGGQWLHGWNGLIGGRESVTELGAQIRHDSINVGLFDTASRRVFATVSDEHVDELEAGVYAQSTTRWFTWFRSVLGVRGDVLNMAATSYSTPANSGSAQGSKLSPKLALTLGPWDGTEFFVDAGRGFHSNDARGVIDRIDPTTGLAASSVPPLVSSFGKEIGVRTIAVPGLESSVALWSLDSDSELVYNADSDIGSTSPNAASRRYGVEWNNRLNAGRHLRFDLDLAWTHARYAEENQNGLLGDMIPNAVARVANLRTSLMDFGPWSAGLETRYIGPYPLSQDGSLVSSPAIVTNLRLTRELARNASLSVDLLNLFDRKYYDIEYEQDFRVTPASPVVPNGITVHPGEPREVRVTLSLRY